MVSLPFRKKQAVRLDDEKAGAAYEQDQTRYSEKRSRIPSPRELAEGSFAPHPTFLRVIRFLMYGATSLSALATAALGIAVVQYYNSHGPVIKPSWGSLIACIAFGIGTPGVLYGMMLFTPFLFRHGSVLGIINQVRLELLMLFGMSVVWISGALALACDLRGRENCLWDGYYHYPKPSDFDNVCNLINVQVALAYTTFGLAAAQMVVVYIFALYTLLYLDQEVLTEPTNDLGGRAYRARKAALARAKTLRTAQRASVSTAGPGSSPIPGAGPMAGGVASSRRVPPPSTDAVPSRSNSNGSSGQERYRDEESGRERSNSRHERDSEAYDGVADSSIAGEGYYGFGQGSRRPEV